MPAPPDFACADTEALRDGGREGALSTCNAYSQPQCEQNRCCVKHKSHVTCMLPAIVLPLLELPLLQLLAERVLW